MRSIRLSLIVYFLVLLALALGAVSFLVYRTTAQAMQEKQEVNRRLLKAEYETRRHEENDKLDVKLQTQSRELATMVQSQFRGHLLMQLRLLALGPILSAPTPNAHVPLGVALGEQMKRDTWFNLTQPFVTSIELNEELLVRESEPFERFFQVDSEIRTWRSKSLGQHSLPFDASEFTSLPEYAERYDDITLDGKTLRRIRWKTHISKFKSIFPPPSYRPPGPPRDRISRLDPPPRTGTRVQESSTPLMIIQCAASTEQRDEALARLDEEHQESLAELDQQSKQSLADLRTHLLWINLATFAGIFLGGSILIGLGLAPLRRLGDAVSRVSENHLKLDYDGPMPPVELRPIIDRLTQALTLLQQAFDREKQSTADISHELRTPLAGLLTTVEVTLRKARSPEEYRETLAECRELAKLMTQLVERLLTLTRIDSRSDRLRVETVDATELTEQCASLIRPLARANGLNLNVHRNGAVQLRTDPDKLREVIANLMHNAVEYNRPAGSVDVSVKSADGTLDLEVTDTGIGIAPEHRQRIFERFFRADPSRQAIGLHAGLGLAIVRGYVELMGGTITVESEMGRGSTFRVRIPSTDPANRT